MPDPDDLYDPADDGATEDRLAVTAPVRLAVEVSCPTCGAIYSIPCAVGIRVVQSDSGEGTIGVQLRASTVAHLCRQMRLDLTTDDAPAEPGRSDA